MALLASTVPAAQAAQAAPVAISQAAALTQNSIAPAQVAPSGKATGPKAAEPKASAADRSDVALNGWGDNRGYHLAVATAAGSWSWHEIAVLRPELIEEASWLGYQCASGDGRYAAVTVLPAAAINSAPARDHGAVGYAVDLVKGTVHPVASGLGFKYHSPGCGTADTAEFTMNPGSDQRSTLVLSANLKTGKISQRSMVAGQVTSVVPTAAGPVGVMGNAVVRVRAKSAPVAIGAVAGTPFDLRPTADGAVAFLTARDTVNTVQVMKAKAGKVTVLGSGPRSTVHLFQGRAGRPVLTGATVTKNSGLIEVSSARLAGGAMASSLSGRALMGEARANAPPVKSATKTAGAVVDQAGASAQSAPPVLETQNGTLLSRSAAASNRPVTTAMPALAAASSAKISPAVAQTPKCAVPRLAENRQVLQPWPAQIDWAAQMAEQGLLTGTAQQRPANYANLGLAAYAPNTDFARVALSHPSSDSWDTVPRSVYEAIMAQESNWAQASWHALPGIAGGPLISDYYGAGGGITAINYTKADCGYGVGQVTSGMATSETTFSANGKTKIAVDYEENIAAGLQILERTWNQLYAAGVTANGGSPRYLENWYFAAWAYNTGIQPNAANGNTTGCTPGPSCTGADGTWGLGWTNNPENADYPPTRVPYLSDSYADAAHPGLWPYEERIMGWMGSPLIRLSQPSYAKPTYNGGSTWLHIPPPSDFCTADNRCDPSFVASDPSLSYCTLTDRACWWHTAVSWSGDCTLQCATSSYTAAAGSSEPAGGVDPHPPTCSLDTSKVPTTSYGAPIIVDESQSQPPLNRVGCGTPNWSQGGTFSMSYGQGSTGSVGEIDTHQIGAGLGGHALFSHTERGTDPSVVNTGTWSPTLPKTQNYKIKVHLPGAGASATDVVYYIYPGVGISPWKIRVNQHWGTEQWVTIGTFGMQPDGYVTLSNTSTDTAYGDGSYSNYDVAWDAIAFLPQGGTLGVPIGGPPQVRDAPAGSNPAMIASGCTCRTAGDPVSTQTGYFSDAFTDLSTPGRGMPLTFTRTYGSVLASSSGPNAAGVVNGPFGYGWTFSYNLSAVTDATSGNVTVQQEDGSQVDFTNTSGTYAPSLPRYDASLVKSGSTYVYTRRGRSVFTFDIATGRLSSETDLAGQKASPAYATALAYDSSGHLTTITDPAMRKYTLTWTGSHITGLTDSAGRQVTYAYDTNDNLTDVFGVVTTRAPSVLNNDRFQYTYTAAHLMASIRKPNAYGSTVTPTPVTAMTYDGSERVTKQTDALGRATLFTYGPDATENLVAGQTQITDPAGHKTIDTYTNGVLTTETKGAGSSNAGTWTYTYDPVTLGTSTITDPDGGVQTFTYDDQGNRTSQSDARGYTTAYTFDDLGDMTSQIDAIGVKTTYQYDDAGHIKTATGTNDGSLAYGLLTGTQQQAIGQGAEVPDGNPPTATIRSTSTYYDDAAHPADPSRSIDARAFTTTKTYDDYGDLISSTDAQSNQTKYGYDTARGLLTSTVTPNGIAAGITTTCTPPSKGCTTYAHDDWGHITMTTDPLGHTSSATFDANGNQTSTTDGNNQRSTVTYDFADEPVSVDRADHSVLRTTYNADGTVHQSIDGAANATTYGYDGQGRRTTVQDANSEITTSTIDPAGNVLTAKDSDGRTTSYTHDPAGELTAIAYSDSTTHGITTTYDSNGRKLSTVDGTGTSTWSYDDFGQVISQKDGTGTTVGYSYDPGGNATSIIYPATAGHTVSQGFDKAGRLTSVKDWNSRTTTFSYDNDSNLTLTTYPNGTTVTPVIDNSDRISSTTLKAGTTTLASISYPRDNAEQISGETPAGVPGSTQTYAYNPLEQVKTSTAGSAATSFTYDAADNPVTIGTRTQAFNAANELCWNGTGAAPATPTCASAPTGSTTYTYNGEGQRTRAVTGTAAVSYGYDVAGRMTSAAKTGMTAGYTYDGSGLRTSKTVNGTTTKFTWDSHENLLYDGSSNYLYGPGGVPIEQLSTTAAQWYFSDQLGSTRALTDATGAVVGGYSYSPYGAVTSATGTVATPLQYAGQYTDSETGFQYLRARYYDPLTAQFITVDPLVSATGTRYGYSKQNPLNGTDPTGLITFTPIACITVSGGFVIGRALTLCPLVVGIDSKNHITVGSTKTWAKNQQSPTLGISAGPEFSNAENIRQLGGLFSEAGGSLDTKDYGSLGLGIYGGQCAAAPHGRVVGGSYSIGYGANVQLPGEVHLGQSNTLLDTWLGDDVKDVKP
jgi:RHS repeat-associated protein